MSNKSPFDTPYTGSSGNNETGLFAYDRYVTRKIQNRDTWRKSNEIGLHRGCVLYFIWIHMAATCYVHMDKVCTECKYDSTCTSTETEISFWLNFHHWMHGKLPSGAIGNKILSKWRHSVSAFFLIYLLVAHRELTRLAQLCCRLLMKSDPIAE